MATKTKSLVSRVDVGKALKMRIDKSMTYEEIGKVFGVSAQAIQQQLQPFKAYIQSPDNTRAFVESKSSILDVVEQELVGALLDPNKQKKASLNNIAYALQNVHSINRLEQNKSTSNINHNSLVQHTSEGIERASKALDVVLEQIEQLSTSMKSDT